MGGVKPTVGDVKRGRENNITSGGGGTGVSRELCQLCRAEKKEASGPLDRRLGGGKKGNLGG